MAAVSAALSKTISGKAALITGAASGIGKAIALKYAEVGCRVAVADINPAGASQVAEELNRKFNSNIAVPVVMDVSSEAQVIQGVQACVDAFGSIDILIPNAGVQHIAPITELSLADWRKITSVHLDGSFLLTREAMKHMVQRKSGGSLIYMGSVHSKQASPLKSPYIAAKHGILGLCKAMAVEGAEHRIVSNIICPGFVYTPLVAKQIPEQAKNLGISEDEVVKNIMLKNTVNKEFVSVEAVADVALFIASFAQTSPALTGQSFIVSNGWHME